MSQKSGIQTLLEAEKQAHEIVSKARAYRTTRLKAAKTDAAAEIAAYKDQKEKELQEQNEANSGNNVNADKEAEDKVKGELEEIEKIASQKQAEVVKLLINAVTKPTPELHVNASS